MSKTSESPPLHHVLLRTRSTLRCYPTHPLPEEQRHGAVTAKIATPHPTAKLEQKRHVVYVEVNSLVSIIRLIPMGSAECERMFSLMNRLKTDLRNRMKTGRLNQLMTVNRLAPSVEDVTEQQLDEWIDFWDSECSKGRYTSYFR